MRHLSFRGQFKFGCYLGPRSIVDEFGTWATTCLPWVPLLREPCLVFCTQMSKMWRTSAEMWKTAIRSFWIHVKILTCCVLLGNALKKLFMIQANAFSLYVRLFWRCSSCCLGILLKNECLGFNLLMVWTTLTIKCRVVCRVRIYLYLQLLWVSYFFLFWFYFHERSMRQISQES